MGEVPPLHRHLSTVGIGSVFLCPAPQLLPQPQIELELSSSKFLSEAYFSHSSPSQTTFNPSDVVKQDHDGTTIDSSERELNSKNNTNAYKVGTVNSSAGPLTRHRLRDDCSTLDDEANSPSAPLSTTGAAAIAENALPHTQINSQPSAPSSLIPPKKESTGALLTWEIVGNIKTIPEDFIVREIGIDPLNKNTTHGIAQVKNNITFGKQRYQCHRIAGLEEYRSKSCELSDLLAEADNDGRPESHSDDHAVDSDKLVENKSEDLNKVENNLHDNGRPGDIKSTDNDSNEISTNLTIRGIYAESRNGTKNGNDTGVSIDQKDLTCSMEKNEASFAAVSLERNLDNTRVNPIINKANVNIAPSNNIIKDDKSFNGSRDSFGCEVQIEKDEVISNNHRIENIHRDEKEKSHAKNDLAHANNNLSTVAIDDDGQEKNLDPRMALKQILVQCFSDQNLRNGSEAEAAADDALKKLDNLLSMAQTEIRVGAIKQIGNSIATEKNTAENMECRPRANSQAPKMTLPDTTSTSIHVAPDKKVAQPDDSTTENVVWLPTTNLFQNIKCSNNGNIIRNNVAHVNWKMLHHYLRHAFPLLKTDVPSIETPSTSSTSGRTSPNHASSSNKMSANNSAEKNSSEVKSTIKPWVCALIDRTFFPLAPYLARPIEDISALYQFRNRGPVAVSSPSEDTNDQLHHDSWYHGSQNRKRKHYPKFGRGRSKQRKCQKEDVTSPQSTEKDRGDDYNNRHANEQGFVLLRLRPELPRNKRRDVHRLIANGGASGGRHQRREFETSTRNDVPLDLGDIKEEKYSIKSDIDGIGFAANRVCNEKCRDEIDQGNINCTFDEPALNSKHDASKTATTTAIVAQWSRSALIAFHKKRNRTSMGNMNDISNNGKNTDNSDDKSKNINNLNCSSEPHRKRNEVRAVYCVLRKRKVEHQVAIQHIVRALHCRPSDVGLAGIKDMQAVTYQFCTLRNVELRKVQRVNETVLKEKRIELSHLEVVHDFLLNRGDLLGNRFEIIVRNLSRVEILPVGGAHYECPESENYPNKVVVPWRERFVPCHASHINSMVSRLQESGFINFYGEQRVGDAGFSSDVGVRSFDVGRAMLQNNFPHAIDLIMMGRSHKVYSPGVEEIKARQVWKSSGGDARATLAAFPKNATTMARERDLMKGLLRYGDALEAIRCIPHNVRLFWIHGYQAYVWNRVATERVRRWGARPVIGDLYLSKSEGDAKTEEFVELVTDPQQVDVSQIVLPLPGYNVRYPSNEIGEMYKKILKDDQVQLQTKGHIAEATAKGSYRKLVQKANNLKWEILRENTDERQGLVLSSERMEDPVVETAQFSFDLESGCYATMFLRELMATTMARGERAKPK